MTAKTTRNLCMKDLMECALSQCSINKEMRHLYVLDCFWSYIKGSRGGAHHNNIVVGVYCTRLNRDLIVKQIQILCFNAVISIVEYVQSSLHTFYKTRKQIKHFFDMQ